jgi:hypothetical protein
MEVTAHAEDRARERLSWKPHTVLKMAARAWNEGVAPGDVKGRLKRFLDSKAAKYNHTDIRIYGEYLYFYYVTFGGPILVTVYEIPQDLKGLIPR